MLKRSAVFAFCSLIIFPVMSLDYVVNLGTDNAVNSGGDNGELRYVLNQILNEQAQGSSSGSHTITFSVDQVNLASLMPPINLFSADTIIIGNSTGAATVIDGASAYRPFFIESGTVTIQNMVIQNCVGQGGSAGTNGAGGGGLGCGGAILIDDATVTISDVVFSSNSAIAGLGGSGTGRGGGGGIGGNGGINLGGGGGYSGIGGNSVGGGGSIGDGGTNIGGGGGAIIGATGGTSSTGLEVSGYVFGGGGSVGENGGGNNPGFSSSTYGGGGGFIGNSSQGGFGGGGGAGQGPNGTTGAPPTNGTASTGGDGGIGGGGGGSVGGRGGNSSNTSNPGGTGGNGTGGAGSIGGGGGGGQGGAGGNGAAGPSGGTGGVGGIGNGGIGNFGGGGGSGTGGSGGSGGNGNASPPTPAFGGNGGNGGNGNGAEGGFGGGGGFGSGGSGGNGGLGTSFSGLGGKGGDGVGGHGGFGGGGGAGYGGLAGLSTTGTMGPGAGTGGLGGVGGSNGIGTAPPATTPIGGDGAAFGGAVFINSGSLTISGNTSTTSNTLSANGGNGAIAGSDFFVRAGSSLTFSPEGGKSVTLTGTISDDSADSVPAGQTWTPGSGSGASLIMNGEGNLILSGVNTYKGGTTISAGTLNIQNNSSLGASSVTISNGGQLQLQGGLSAVSNTLTMNGGSLYNVSGVNTYAGPISLLNDASIGGVAGTLLLNNSSAITATGDTITFNGGCNTDVSGAISLGSGGLTQSGSGMLTLGGVNSYTGITSISDGILQIADESNIGGSSAILSLAGGELHTTASTTISGNSTVTANSTLRSDVSTTLLGTVTGSNNSTLTLNGTGTTAFSTIEVNGGDVFTISGNFGGSSSLTKLGLGTLAFAGTSSYTGTMTVSDGKCTVNGTMPGNILAQSGTTINGNGTVQGTLSIGSGASLRPGNSIGTIVVGTLDLDLGSITNIEFDDTTSSLVQVSGIANLAGTLNLIQDAGSYASSGSYEILSAGTLNGTFNQITGGLPGYSFQLKYLNNQVFLEYMSGSPIVKAFIATEGLTGNILKFANYLNESAPSSSEYAILTTLSGSALYNALNSASPARNAFGSFVTEQTLFSFSRIVNNYLGNQRFLKHSNAAEISLATFLPEIQKLYADNSNQCFAPGNKHAPITVWTSGFADFAHEAKESQNPAFNFISEGLLIGFDYESASYNKVGCSLGYAHSQIYDCDHMGGANIPYYCGSLYSSFSLNQFYLQTAFWAVFHQIHRCRNIDYPGVNTKAKGTSNGWQIDPHIEFGYDVETSWSTVEPYAAIDCAINWEGSFKEHGAGNLNMRQKSHTSYMLQSEAGIRFYQSICKSYGRFGFKEGVSYINRVPFGTGKISTAIVGSSAFVTLQSFTRVQNLGAINIDFFAELGKKHDVLVSLGYEGQFGSSYIFNEVLLNIVKRF